MDGSHWRGREGLFLSFTEGLTKRFCQKADQLAQETGRKVKYLAGVVDKEDLVQEIRQKEGVAENGLVAVLSALEMGMSYNMFRCRDRDFAALKKALRKFKHYYFYWDDGRFGLTQVRLSSWFPFNVHVVLNGREWLAQQMDAKGIEYLRRDNCFIHISDFERAQKLADHTLIQGLFLVALVAIGIAFVFAIHDAYQGRLSHTVMWLQFNGTPGSRTVVHECPFGAIESGADCH